MPCGPAGPAGPTGPATPAGPGVALWSLGAGWTNGPCHASGPSRAHIADVALGACRSGGARRSTRSWWAGVAVVAFEAGRPFVERLDDFKLLIERDDDRIVVSNDDHHIDVAIIDEDFAHRVGPGLLISVPVQTRNLEPSPRLMMLD
jgi:hypothetical protein